MERQLAVYVASIKLVPQFLVPLFYQSVDEKWVTTLYYYLSQLCLNRISSLQAICPFSDPFVSSSDKTFGEICGADKLPHNQKIQGKRNCSGAKIQGEQRAAG